jgi:hypothetical protein
MILALVGQCSRTKEQEGRHPYRGSKPAQGAFAFDHRKTISHLSRYVRQTHFQSGQAKVGGSVSGGTAEPSGKASELGAVGWIGL